MLPSIRDEGLCGACYAVTVADSISAVFNINTNNVRKVALSYQEIIDCCQWTHGCEGDIGGSN